MLTSFKASAGFWEDLQYDINKKPPFINDSNEIELSLHCNLWNRSKVSVLLEAPLALRSYNDNLPSLGYFQKLEINAHFTHLIEEPLEISFIKTHFNEFLSSLIISQLEFQYPLVFSNLTRKRFFWQEKDIGPVSYALTDSSSLLPTLVTLMNNDTTATTAYQLLECRSNRFDPICFKILQ